MSSGSEHLPDLGSAQLRRNEWDAHAETRQRIKEGLEGFEPDTFELFLSLPGIDLASPRLLDHYIERYLGTYTTRAKAINAYLDHLGWVETTTRFLTTDPGTGKPTWNWDLINEGFTEQCHAPEKNGRIHVFTV